MNKLSLVQLNVLVPPDVARKIRACAALRDETLGELVERATRPMLSQARLETGEPPIAEEALESDKPAI